jgi:hypothetical protein
MNRAPYEEKSSRGFCPACWSEIEDRDDQIGNECSVCDVVIHEPLTYEEYMLERKEQAQIERWESNRENF